MSMNPEFKQKWVDALRSGEYKQGTGELHNIEADTYCCLGVVCEVIKPKGWDGLCLTGLDRDGEFARLQNFLTQDVLDLLNVTETQASILWQMNDGFVIVDQPKSFDEIATYIEENL